MNDSTSAKPGARKRLMDDLRADLPAGTVVFLIALPLCLGIAFASGAPPLAGLITGIVAGLVVPLISRAELSVSGPAAGLTVIVAGAITDLGSYGVFLTAVCLAGVIQLGLGIVRAGLVAYYVPSSVIKGMLAGIGAILILKQIPHALGLDEDFEGDLGFFEQGGRNTLGHLLDAILSVHAGAVAIAVVGLAVLIVWGRVPALERLRHLPGPLVAVVLGMGLAWIFELYVPALALHEGMFVDIPFRGGPGAMIDELQFPDPSAIANVEVWKVAGVLAVVASIETLLCIEAIDKQDPLQRTTPPSRELAAQGVGNFVAGLLGGIPMTAVIIRGSANIQAGGRTRKSTVFHGVLLLVAVMAVPGLLSRIPLAALAAILLHVGFKLAPPVLFKQMFRADRARMLPFFVTFLALVFTDLLTGVLIGMVVGVFFVLRAHVSTAYIVHQRSSVIEDGRERVRVELAENVSFLNKAAINKLLHGFPDGSIVEIDGTRCTYIDPDVIELVEDFVAAAPSRDIRVHLRGFDGTPLDDQHAT